MTAEGLQDREAFAALPEATRELVDRVYRAQVAPEMLEAYREGYESGWKDGVELERERIKADLPRADPAACIGCIMKIMVRSVPGHEQDFPRGPEKDTKDPSTPT